MAPATPIGADISMWVGLSPKSVSISIDVNLSKGLLAYKLFLLQKLI